MVLYTERRGRIRVVTAYEMKKREQQSYFQRDMNVPKEQITIPKFKTEAEEAAWDSHPEPLQRS
jgi:hypothetical protein